MKNNKIIFGLLFLVTIGCADLDTQNLNRADIERVLANPDDYVGVVEGQYNVLWHATQHWTSANALTFGTVADSHTSSWGNFGMKDMSSEPRTAIDNQQTYTYAYVIESSYEDNYAVIGAVNDVLRLMDADPDIVVLQEGVDVTIKTKAQALYLQGVAYGNLALTYDKAKFVDENVDLADVAGMAYSPYGDLMTSALSKLELAITTANSAPDFTVTGYNGITISRDDYVRLMRTLQAKFMIYVARTDAENSATNWADVLTKANAGITSDFAPIGDGSSWWDAYKYYGTEGGWARVDMRVINAMDPSQPSRFPTDNSHPLPPASGDNRLTSDMTYNTGIPFRANRGLYHYSHYDYSRYDYHYPGATGDMPHTTVVESDLIKAEALVRTAGDKNLVATLINNTRDSRGGLTPMTGADSDTDLLNAILHERYVELYSNMGGIPFYDRRRSVDDDGGFRPYSGLQALTFRQMPIPAKELNILGEDIYTFGGADN